MIGLSVPWLPHHDFSTVLVTSCNVCACVIAFCRRLGLSATAVCMVYSSSTNGPAKTRDTTPHCTVCADSGALRIALSQPVVWYVEFGELFALVVSYRPSGCSYHS